MFTVPGISQSTLAMLCRRQTGGRAKDLELFLSQDTNKNIITNTIIWQSHRFTTVTCWWMLYETLVIDSVHECYVFTKRTKTLYSWIPGLAYKVIRWVLFFICKSLWGFRKYLQQLLNSILSFSKIAGYLFPENLICDCSVMLTHERHRLVLRADHTVS